MFSCLLFSFSNQMKDLDTKVRFEFVENLLNCVKSLLKVPAIIEKLISDVPFSPMLFKVQAQVKDLARKLVSPKFVEVIIFLLDTPHWRIKKYILDILNAVFSIEALLLNEKMEDEVVFVKEERPRCPHGADCQSVDPSHFMEYQHTSEAKSPEKPKDTKGEESTEVCFSPPSRTHLWNRQKIR